MIKTVRGIMLILLLVGVLLLFIKVHPVRAGGTIYILYDGSIEPPSAPILFSGDMYSLTANTNDSIAVERSNIIIDGAGFIVEGDGSDNGISLYSVSNVTVQNTNIRNSSYGIYIEWGSNNIIIENNITANKFEGIGIFDSSGNTIGQNTVEANTFLGVGVYYSSNNSVYENNIIANEVGVGLYNSSSNTIYRNRIATNYNGIEFLSGSDNSVFHNSFVNNVYQVSIKLSVNIWHMDSEGNHWSNYNGTDVDRNGIGDTPYIINENNTDSYPLIFPYGFAPSSDLNKDGTVNVIDISILALAFGSRPGDSNWSPYADMNLDEKINIIDITIVAQHFGRTA